MPIDKDKLSKLKPEERIKKLKLLEEERKKEVNEIGKLIKESMQELKTGKLAQEITPEQKSVDISSLFEVSGAELELAVGGEKTAAAADGRGSEIKGYRLFAQAYDDYSSLKKFMGYAAEMGGLSQKQLEAVDTIGERLDKTRYEHAGSEIANILVASRAALHKIRKYSG